MDKPTVELLRKFIANQCSAPELKQVEELLREGAHNEEWGAVLEELAVDQFLSPAADHFPNKVDQQKLLGRIQATAGIHPNRQRSYLFAWSAAAACILLAGAALLFIVPRYNRNSGPAITAKAGKTETFNHRLLKLADGSTVLLNDSSSLSNEKFSGSTREVTLSGEAYFDIEHDAAHPFIIHTGELTTTVLGTAFNIRAFEKEKTITVTVTRGKVSVKKGKQLLGVLIPDQQISYDLPAATHQQQAVAAENWLTWKKNDLILDDVTLEEAASLIGKQYGKKVHFDNQQVKSCRFSASFLNRSSLEQVLAVVGEITGTTLLVKNNRIEISGQGCQ